MPTYRRAVDALPNSIAEGEFVDYTRAIFNYYVQLFIEFKWKPDSPVIKQVTGQCTDSATISEVNKKHLVQMHRFINLETIIYELQGVSLIECYHSFLMRKGWELENFHLKSWLCQLCRFINFKNKPQDCIRVLCSQRPDSRIVAIHKKSLITMVNLQ